MSCDGVTLRHEALLEAQCDAFAQDGWVTICHRTGSSKNPDCKGQGCLPKGAGGACAGVKGGCGPG